MIATERRLTKIEAALTPSQAILCFLDELTEQGSLAAHLRAQQGLPATAQSLVKLIQQVEHATREAHPREEREVVQRAVRQAVRDVVFLHCLLMRLNETLHADRRLRWYQLATIVGELEAPLRELRGEAPRPVNLERAGGLAVELQADQQAVRLVAQRYYAGREIRCPDLAEDQDLLLEQLRSALAIHEETTALLTEGAPTGQKLRGKAEPAPNAPLDQKAIERAAAQLAEEESTYWIDLAKSEAHRFMGELEPAGAILARYLC